MFDFDGFGQRLLKLRKKKNMTQGEFADRLGVTGQAVSKWENDQSYPDITLIPTIATILDVEINCLFGFKKKNFKSDIQFPKIYDDLLFVHHYQNIACYSSKEVDSIDGSGIKFKDGSTAELSNRLIVNIGQGEIRLLVSDEVDIDIDLSKTSTNLEFDYVDSLDIEVLSNRCEIIRSSDNKCRVHAKGEARFIDMMNIMVQEEKLIIRFDNKEGYNNNSYKENIVKVELPCEIGKAVFAKVNGSGEFISEINKFENGKLMINGSGSIRMHDVQSCSSVINGSGFIIARSAEKANFSINGSGEINWETVQTMDASINGSGDVIVKNATSANININGSGDVKLSNMSGDGEAILRISGSGSIYFASGSCRKLDININGSGDIDATGVTVQKASIIIESNGQVTLGRVVESSVEQIKKKGVIKILNRGEI